YIGYGLLEDTKTNLTVQSNETLALSKTFVFASMVEKWQQCCNEAVKCCHKHLSIHEKHRMNVCPKTWDGWTCWENDTPTSFVTTKPCPSHIYWKMDAPPCTGYVVKECDERGEWFKKEGREWSNYINCARDDPRLKPLIILAYGVPFITTLLYTICRFISSYDYFNEKNTVQNEISIRIVNEDSCWLLPSVRYWNELIINGPNLAILIVNFVFLISMLREIYRKALSVPSNNSTPSHPQRNLIRAPSSPSNSTPTGSSLLVSLRAASLLLPLYGLHYLFIVYRPDISVCWLSETYHYASLTLDGLQATLVSILFCFTNNEVRQLIKRALCGTRDQSVYLT
ncbi:Hormone receptor-like protein, partial [Dinothrombium tinctorium]